MATSNFTASPKYQRYRQAADDWIRAKLRKESGAVIGEQEMTKEYEVYFPQPGDSDDVIAQKGRARKQAEDGMLLGAGGYREEYMSSLTDNADDASSPPIGDAKQAADGSWYVQRDGKYYKVSK